MGVALVNYKLIISKMFSSSRVFCSSSFRNLLKPLRSKKTNPSLLSRHLSILPEVCPLTDTRREFSEKKTLGYTAEQVYNVVADINQYKEFLPWCKESKVLKERPGQCIARLTVGFPPFGESYTSLVYLRPHTLLRSIATDGRLFSHLETTWQFQPGPTYPSGPSVLIQITSLFEFRSMIYAGLANPVFNEVARTLASSFEARCEVLYGPDHLKNHKHGPDNSYNFNHHTSS